MKPRQSIASPMPAGRHVDRHERDGLHERALRIVATEPSWPHPGKGRTLQRWRRLAALAADDLCLVKVLEAHHDARAILRDLGHRPPPPSLLHAVWAAEPPGARLEYRHGTVSGTKAWCSGAGWVHRALVTAREGEAVRLVLVDMNAPGIVHDAGDWNAVGMGRVVSGRVHFDRVAAEPVGGAGDYLARPGFWHGGAGVAACWFGAAAAIAETLRTHPRVAGDPHACVHLGAIDVGLSAAAAQLRHNAQRIDDHPEQPHRTEVMRTRALVERLAAEIIERVGRALGPTPLCQDLDHARRCSDLAVFIRQGHAERDWASLGTYAAARTDTWTL